MNRRGFTFIELITVVVVIGVLASIALPKYQMFKKRAQSADIMTEMVAVRTAAFAYNESNGTWPPSAALGQTPTGLATYLPGNFSFQHSDYSLAWTALNLNLFGSSSGWQLIWMSTTDGVLCQGVAGLWGGSRNVDLLQACSSNGGVVLVFVDR